MVVVVVDLERVRGNISGKTRLEIILGGVSKEPTPLPNLHPPPTPTPTPTPVFLGYLLASQTILCDRLQIGDVLRDNLGAFIQMHQA